VSEPDDEKPREADCYRMKPRLMRGVRHDSFHAQRGFVIEIARKFLYCTLCGSLRPLQPYNSPWFQVGDPEEIREWTLKQWGLDPTMFRSKTRKKVLEEKKRAVPPPVEPHAKGSTWTAAQLDDLVARHERGETWRRIGRAYGLAESTVQYLALRRKRLKVYDRVAREPFYEHVRPRLGEVRRKEAQA